MNTKLNFNCTELTNGEILRNDFEVIISEEFPHVWLDENISKIYNLFGFNLVYSWEITSTEEVDEDVTEVKLVKIISGRILFEDDVEQRILLLKAENYELLKERLELLEKEKQNVIKEPEKNPQKDYPSCWIDLSGVTYFVGFADHEEWAREYLEKHFPEEFDEFKISLRKNSFCYEILQDKGWIRILGWTDPPTFVIPKQITPKQSYTLRQYCISNKLLYKDFPEILKS